MIRRPPRSTLFPTRRSSDLRLAQRVAADAVLADQLAFRRHAAAGRVHAALDAGGQVVGYKDVFACQGVHLPAFLYGIVAENSITYTYILCKPPPGFPPGGAGKGHPGGLGPHRIARPAPNPPGKNCGKICPEQLTKRKSCAKLLLASERRATVEGCPSGLWSWS